MSQHTAVSLLTALPVYPPERPWCLRISSVVCKDAHFPTSLPALCIIWTYIFCQSLWHLAWIFISLIASRLIITLFVFIHLTFLFCEIPVFFCPFLLFLVLLICWSSLYILYINHLFLPLSSPCKLPVNFVCYVHLWTKILMYHT